MDASAAPVAIELLVGDCHCLLRVEDHLHVGVGCGMVVVFVFGLWALGVTVALDLQMGSVWSI